jgi:uncharacterized glyoxalase superfamily protein PhnB
MQLNPHLSFNGQCEAAFRFYEKCLGGKVIFMMTYGDSTMAEQVPCRTTGARRLSMPRLPWATND